MSIPIYQVDAFTDRPFSGNPAAVCILPEPRDTGWMQNLAAEMNLSETAFLVKEPDGFQLRWFTPTMEVPVCGHATLASAYILYETGRLAPDQPARFNTRSGWLTGERKGNLIELDFPADPPQPVRMPVGLDQALGVSVVNVEKGALYLVVETGDPERLRRAQPNLQNLLEVTTDCIALTSRSDDEEYDFLSRFFAPSAGIPEDPVTGSAHCLLGPYWSNRLDKQEMVAYQASPRGGMVRVGCRGARVILGGQAVTIFSGVLQE